MNIVLLKELMVRYINRPTNSMVNSDSSFIRCDLVNASEHELARKYWSWVCMRSKNNPEWVDEDIIHYQSLLDESLQRNRLPEWATRGT